MRLNERPREGRLLAGVSLAIGRSLTIDVTLVRLAFFLLALAWGIGLLLYLLLWLLIPDEERLGEGDGLREVARANISTLRHELRMSGDRLTSAWNRRDDAFPWPRPLDRRWLAMGLVVVGALILLASLGAFAWVTAPRAIGLAVIALGAGVLLNIGRR